MGLLLAALLAFAPLPRATVDRPDEAVGPQVHVVYAVPSDLPDRALDTDGTLTASVLNWEGWLRQQTQGRFSLRLDTVTGAPDITFVRLPESDAQLAGQGAFVRDEIERLLHMLGFDAAGKIYAIYYDGTSTFACGGGAWPPSLPGDVGALYLRSTQPGFPCYDPSGSRAGLQLMDLAILHELLHTLGFVPNCAPHQTRRGHVSDSFTDLMWAGDSPPYWRPETLDVGHDDYFDAHIPSCLDLIDSPYLAKQTFKLRVRIVGKGRIAGLKCTHMCELSVRNATLRAVPAKEWRFAGWSGACNGKGLCRLQLTADANVLATFTKKRKPRPRASSFMLSG